MIDDDSSKAAASIDQVPAPGQAGVVATMDIDGDGIISSWESNLCRLCLIGALMIAFGDKIITSL